MRRIGGRSLRKSQNPEGRLVLQILHYLRACGCEAGKIKTMGVKRGNRYCFDPYLWRGVADILAFTPRLVFIEAKSPTGVQSKEQMIFQEYCTRAGITYILARSLEDVIKGLAFSK